MTSIKNLRLAVGVKKLNIQKNYFSFSMGGVVGGECIQRKDTECPIGHSVSRVPISDNAIKLLRLFQFKGGNIKEYSKHLDKCFEIIKKLKADEAVTSDKIREYNKEYEQIKDRIYELNKKEQDKK